MIRTTTAITIALASALFTVGVATIAGADSQANPPQRALRPPVRVLSCVPNPPVRPYRWFDPYGRYYSQPAIGGSLSIDYVNKRTAPATAIEFGLVARDVLVAEVRDEGTFSKGVPIKHTFGISNQVFPLGTALPQCTVLRVKFADRTTWQNPNPPKI